MKFDSLGFIKVTGTSGEGRRVTIHFRVRKWHPAYWLLLAKTFVKLLRFGFSR